MFQMLNRVVLFWYYITVIKITILSQFLVEYLICFFQFFNYKNIVVVSFTSSSQFRFPIKLIYYIAFESVSNTCCLLKSIALIL